MSNPSTRLLLRDLPFPARLVLAAFLISVGVGYFSALLQMHFQAASPGQPLPGTKEAGEIYHGKPVMSQLERLLVADEAKPFNGSGSMRSAFFGHSTGWKGAIPRRARQLKLDPKKKTDLLKAEKELRGEREGEIRALLDWIHAGMDRKYYEDDAYPLPATLKSHPLTAEFVEEAEGSKVVRIKSILDTRCMRCHTTGSTRGAAGQAPLENYEEVHAYGDVETAGTGMSLQKLAQTSHVHLLGFAMLYGMTGLIFSFTRFPCWMRLTLAPLPLIAQVVEIGVGWWGGRVYEPLALAIPVVGTVVAVGLLFQIIGSLFDLFGRVGQAVLLILLIGAVVGVGALKVYVMDPYLKAETQGAVLTTGEETPP
jgi:hypothetical protein